jgi:hypothetical protein
MDRIWLFTNSFLSGEILGGVLDHTPAIKITHHTDSRTRKLEAWDRRIGARPNPAADLVIKQEHFETDFFTWGRFMFVSERMRKVMALPPSEVRFFEIDDSQSAPRPRSMNYQLMQPDVVEDVGDVERSKYQVIPVEGFPPRPPDVSRLVFRPDAAPKHDLFFDRFFSIELLCTDAFAMRILRAGCTGAKFVDPSDYFGDVRVRTLRGVEKLLGVDGNGSEITELVEAIE